MPAVIIHRMLLHRVKSHFTASGLSLSHRVCATFKLPSLEVLKRKGTTHSRTGLLCDVFTCEVQSRRTYGSTIGTNKS